MPVVPTSIQYSYAIFWVIQGTLIVENAIEHLPYVGANCPKISVNATSTATQRSQSGIYPYGQALKTCRIESGLERLSA